MALLFIQEDMVLDEVVHVRIPILFKFVGNRLTMKGMT